MFPLAMSFASNHPGTWVSYAIENCNAWLQNSAPNLKDKQRWIVNKGPKVIEPLT